MSILSFVLTLVKDIITTILLHFTVKSFTTFNTRKNSLNFYVKSTKIYLENRKWEQKIIYTLVRLLCWVQAGGAGGGEAAEELRDPAQEYPRSR